MTPKEKAFKLKRYNIISDWLDRYGDPAIDEKVEKELKKISNMEQTAVDSLIKSILPFIDRSKVSDMMLQDIVSEHLAMEKEQIGYPKEKVDKLIYALYNNNMCSTIGDELIETFKNEITCKEDI